MNILVVFFFHKYLQGGPLSVINGVITPISRVITPVTHFFSAIYRGYNSIYNDRRGPPCTYLKKTTYYTPQTWILKPSSFRENNSTKTSLNNHHWWNIMNLVFFMQDTCIAFPWSWGYEILPQPNPSWNFEGQSPPWSPLIDPLGLTPAAKWPINQPQPITGEKNPSQRAGLMLVSLMAR